MINNIIQVKLYLCFTLAASHIRREHSAVRPVHRCPLWYPDTWRAFTSSASSLWTLYGFTCIWSSTSYLRLTKPQRCCSLTHDAWEYKGERLLSALSVNVHSHHHPDCSTDGQSKNLDVKSLCLRKTPKVGHDLLMQYLALHYQRTQTTTWKREEKNENQYETHNAKQNEFLLYLYWKCKTWKEWHHKSCGLLMLVSNRVSTKRCMITGWVYYKSCVREHTVQIHSQRARAILSIF